jgi:UDP-N-acetylmuramate--alanine ligase
MNPVDLSQRRRIHVIGIAGPGMSALATVLAEMGHHVTGSDLRDLPVLDRVRKAGAKVLIGHDATAVDGADYVVASSIIPESNIEWEAAGSKGIARVRRAEMLAGVCARAKAVAVAGTHGKTTSSAMLALVLTEADMDPSFLIGGDIPGFVSGSDELTSARWSGGEYFVVEADESDGTHSQLPVYASVVTNIDTDHLDHFGSYEAIKESFAAFIQASSKAVVNVDDPDLAVIANGMAVTTCGFSERADYKGSSLTLGGGQVQFRVQNALLGTYSVTLNVIGAHNAANALGVFALACELGVDPNIAVKALSKYQGAIRRCEARGEANGAELVDDYAHLPAEIAAVLGAMRADRQIEGRLIAVFQPNRFNRMAVMSHEYANAFKAADIVYINNVYSSGTTFIEGVTGQLVVDAVLGANPDTKIQYIESRDELVDAVAAELREGDVCVSMGCGDIEHFPTQLIAKVQQ